VSEQDNVPRTRDTPGTYEVWFLTFTDRGSGAGYWVRSAMLNPKNGPSTAGVWFARFDPADPARTFGLHQIAGQAELAESGFEVSIDDSVMRSGHASGSIEGGEHRAQWELRYGTGGATYRLLPDLMDRGPLASTHPVAPNPLIRVSGTISIDGERSEVIDAHGEQGHLYGTRHAERWAWAACSDFIGEEAALHVLTAQGRRGPFLTPFLTTVGVRWRERWIRLWNVGRRRPFGLGRWRLDVGTRRYRLTGWIEAPGRDMLRARYEDPDGTFRYCHNSEVASSRLALFERRAGGFEEVALLESRGTTHAEWAGLTPAPAVERAVVEVSA
jgi:hypothetical protein